MTSLGFPEWIEIPDEYELRFNGAPTMDQAESAAATLRAFRNGTPYWIGDFMLQSEGAFGEDYSQLLDLLEDPRSYGTVANYKSTCAKVGASVRRKSQAQSISHCSAVTKFDPPDQIRWLTRSRQNDWSVADLREAIKAEAGETEDVSFEASKTDKHEKFAKKIAKIIEQLAPLVDGAPTKFQGDNIQEAIDLLQEAKQKSDLEIEKVAA